MSERRYAGGQECECGQVVSPAARFCQWCGEKLRERIRADGGWPEGDACPEAGR
jgi:uncharacterized OB-fold protein